MDQNREARKTKFSKGSRLPATLPWGAVRLGLKSGDLEQALEELVPLALRGAGLFFKGRDIYKRAEIEIQKTAAFIHARVEGLSAPRASLGIFSEGVAAPSPAPGKIFVVFLCLAPRKGPNPEIRHWARSRFDNEKIVYELSSAPDLETVVRILVEGPSSSHGA